MSGKCEFQYVYLYRKDLSCKSIVENGSGALESHNKVFFTATDYFNEMIVVEGKPCRDELASIWGIWPGSDNGQDDVAAQSYTLYSNENTEEIFGGDCKKVPFECLDKMYLSIIQVHITPESWARWNREQIENDKPLKELAPFLKELKKILETYCRENPEIICKIYYMLSSGDFAVVVASDTPSASIQIATQIRRRKKVVKGEKSFVLFKTYTLVALRKDYKGKTVSNGDVIVRGCYSNLYWSEYDEIRKELRKKHLPENIGQLLNGRYDFTVKLTYDEYQMAIGEKEESNSSSNVKWFKFMMKYLSYINVRLLLKPDVIRNLKGVLDENDVELEFCSEKENFLYDSIGNNIKKALEYHDKVRKKLENLKGERKNLRHNMHLLKKFILLCKTINSVSDTRIYAVVILNQICSILMTMESTMEVYIKSNYDPAILDEINECLQQSIQSVDAYAEYIRNNNLQTLQMPNYCIETSSSIEKLLIGYSEFVGKMYEIRGLVEEDLEDKEDGTVVPVVVPTLDAQSVSVEVMFADGIGNNWEEELEIRKSRANRKLLVLKSPTLTELANVGTMIFSLMHEVAHQIRYESRKERNSVITKICFYYLADNIAEAFCDKFQLETGERDITFEISRMVVDVVYSTLIDMFLENSVEDNSLSLKPYQETPLIYYRKVLYGWWKSFIQAYEQYNKEGGLVENVKKDILYYFKITKQYYSYNDKKIRELVNTIFYALEKVNDNHGDKEEQKKLLETFKSCHRHILNKCGQINGMTKNYKCFANLGEVIIHNLESMYVNEYIYDSNTKIKENFEEKLYQKLCDRWKVYFEENVKDVDCVNGNCDDVLLQIWNIFGRWLGIDFNTSDNQKRMTEVLSDIISQKGEMFYKDFSRIIGQYREETADIFMCVIGKLAVDDYLHLMIINLKNESIIEKKYIVRILRVIDSVWIEKGKEEDIFKKLVRCAVDDIGKIFELLPEQYGEKKVRADMMEQYENVICQNGRAIELADWKVEQEYAMVLEKASHMEEQIQFLCDELYEQVEIYYSHKELSKEAGQCIREAWKMMRHYRTYICLLKNILNDVPYFLRQFSEQNEYKKDLKKGKEKYRKVISGSSINQFEWRKLCPIYPKLGMENQMKYNQYSVELLMELFYQQKIYYAQNPEIEWIENDKN